MTPGLGRRLLQRVGLVTVGHHERAWRDAFEMGLVVGR